MQYSSNPCSTDDKGYPGFPVIPCVSDMTIAEIMREGSDLRHRAFTALDFHAGQLARDALVRAIVSCEQHQCVVFETVLFEFGHDVTADDWAWNGTPVSMNVVVLSAIVYGRGFFVGK